MPFMVVEGDYGGREAHSTWAIARGPQSQTLLKPDTVRFDVKSGGNTDNTSLRNYLRRKYHAGNIGSNLVIDVGSNGHPVYIPADKLVILQDYQIVEVAARMPGGNRRDIETDGARMFALGTGGDLEMVADASMMKLDARLLPNPSLSYLSRAADNTWTDRLPRNTYRTRLLQQLRLGSVETKKVGSRSLQDEHFLRVPKAPQCAWVRLGTANGRSLNNLPDWIKCIEDAVPRRRSLESLKKILEDATNKRHFDIIFVLLDDANAANYEMVKRVADVELGINTICTIATKGWLKTGWPYAANMMMKVNLKMGGINTSLDLSKHADTAQLLTSQTMIVGADVTHPGPGSAENSDSIAAVVATYENTFSQYPASIRCQPSRQEMIEQIGEMFADRLDLWTRKDPKRPLPNRILFFRDGVSECQFQSVVEVELPKIEQELTTIYGKRGQPLPQILVVCVAKRVNTRFYATTESEKHCDHTENILPGLVVDQTVVRPWGSDFYMQSQIALQGTAKPTHYVVISDTTGVPAGLLQQAIFQQCWTFATSLAPISVHPAARMADKACGRARAYLRDFSAPGFGHTGNAPMDRTGNAQQARDRGVHPDLQDTTFYV